MSSGLRISQGGIPISKAADYQMVMDDRWPTAEMSFMGVTEVKNYLTTVPYGIAVVPVFKHDLGYLPLYSIQLVSYSGFSLTGAPIFVADKTFIYLYIAKDFGVAAIVSAKVFVSVFNRNCAVEFAAPIDIVTASQKSVPSRYGLKVRNTVDGAGMSESNKGKYNFNTNAKTFTIQMHGTRTSNADTEFELRITHRLGYPPSYLIAAVSEQVGIANSLAGVITSSPVNSGVGLARNNSLTLVVRGAQAALTGDFMFLILKDPVDLAR